VIALEPLYGRGLEALRRQPLLLGDAEEVASRSRNGGNLSGTTFSR